MCSVCTHLSAFWRLRYSPAVGGGWSEGSWQKISEKGGRGGEIYQAPGAEASKQLPAKNLAEINPGKTSGRQYPVADAHCWQKHANKTGPECEICCVSLPILCIWLCIHFTLLYNRGKTHKYLLTEKTVLCYYSASSNCSTNSQQLLFQSSGKVQYNVCVRNTAWVVCLQGLQWWGTHTF